MSALIKVKTRPIIFSAPMVNAILSGTKTQTRRIVKAAPDDVRDGWYPDRYNKTDEWTFWGPRGSDESGKCTLPLFRCPYGVPGDRVWVRESFTRGVIPAQMEGGSLLQRGPLVTEGQYEGWQQAAWYDGTDDPWGWFSDRKRVSSMYMPRWASRILLEIMDVRIERLQAISEADAVAEGLSKLSKDQGRTFKYGLADRDGLPGEDNMGWHWDRWNVDPRKTYRHLWETLHGAAGWEANPWVFVVSFERVTT